MTQYRLQPVADRRWWLSLFGAATAILLLPAVLLPVIPTRDVSEGVFLGARDGWSIPLDRECRPSSDALLDGWSCGDVLVQTMIVEGGRDPDRTLRRMLRAMSPVAGTSRAEILREGEARMLIDDWSRSVAVSLEGTGERSHLTMVGVLTGPGGQVVPLADEVWQEFTGRELPAIVREAIATPGEADDGFRFPFELTQVVAS